MKKHLIITSILYCAFIHWSCNTNTSKVDSSHQTEEVKFSYLEASIDDLQQGYKNGSHTVTQVVQAYLDRIKQLDPYLNSVITVNPDALAIAKTLDEDMDKKEVNRPLYGIPILLKDNIDTHDQMPTTAGSKALAQSFPKKDSHIAKLLREAGAVIIGKTNLSEWANFRGENSTSGWSGVGGQTNNPYDLLRNPCGSSSGSGVAVSANLTVLAIGTETNGSIVCPSHANGIVGIKPTVGLLSRTGIIPISFTQDTPGPMARTVRDAVICLGAMTGIDPQDKKTLASEGIMQNDYTQYLKKDGLKNKKIGLFTKPMGINQDVDDLLNQAVMDMKELGAQVIEIEEITNFDSVGNFSFQVMLFEYKDGLNKYFKTLGENSPIKDVNDLISFNESDPLELKHFDQRYLEMASEKEELDNSEYIRIIEKMTFESRQNGIDKIMDAHGLDAIIAPTGSPAWLTDLKNGDTFELGSSSPAARAGYPNITVPMGQVDDLPVGISIFGKAWSEPKLIEIAYAYEQKTKHRFLPTFKNKPTE